MRYGAALRFYELVQKLEVRMNKKKFVMGWSIAVGAMDAVTGLLMVVAPEMVLKMLGIAPVSPDALVFLSWMGVFVGGVGLSYVIALGDRRMGQAVWMVTALVRLLVAVFVTWRIADGSLAGAWVSVALTDLVVAVVQTAVVRAGWWEERRR
jgi:Na+-driven multidrug efflux pump